MRLVKDESGQDLIEYALVVALIALAATAGMSTLATSISIAFGSVGTNLGNLHQLTPTRESSAPKPIDPPGRPWLYEVARTFPIRDIGAPPA